MSFTTINMSYVLFSLATQLPLIIVCFLGIVLALLQVQRLPRVATLVTAGLALLILAAVVQPLVQPFVQALAMRQFNARRGPPQFALISTGIAGTFNVVRAIAIALVAYAAFIDRPFLSFTNSPLSMGESGRPKAGP